MPLLVHHETAYLTLWAILAGPNLAQPLEAVKVEIVSLKIEGTNLWLSCPSKRHKPILTI
jgi:hypothetical protein